jgi:AcrR family transcriptional regulator
VTNTGSLEEAPANRPYESPLRRAQAETTRATVLNAAAALFTRQGYLRTTMKAIAAEAGTSVETVYAQGGKAALLLACVDRALAGDDEDVPLTDRTEFAAALAEPTTTGLIEGWVRALAGVAVRAGGLLVAFEDAAAAEATTAALWAEAEEHRKADCRRLALAVADRGPLPAGWDVDTATEALWLVLHPRSAHTALQTLGWSSERVVDAVSRQVRALLLPLPVTGSRHDHSPDRPRGHPRHGGGARLHPAPVRCRPRAGARCRRR